MDRQTTDRHTDREEGSARIQTGREIETGSVREGTETGSVREGTETGSV